MSGHEVRARSPLVAGLLSTCCVGVGQVYAGRINRGLALLAVGSLLGAVGQFGLLPASLPGWARWLALGCGAAGLLVWLWAIRDARRLAREAGEGYRLKEYNRAWVYALLMLMPLPLGVTAAALVRGHVVRAYRVPSKSMSPSVPPGTRVLADLQAYARGPVERGDVVVFVFPDARHKTYIKRVVGLPGERVAVSADQRVRVDGRLLAGEDGWEGDGGRRWRVLAGEGAASAEVVVPRGHVFVLGDHRLQSKDSRHFGAVPLRDVMGRVDRAFWPSWSSLRPVAD